MCVFNSTYSGLSHDAHFGKVQFRRSPIIRFLWIRRKRRLYIECLLRLHKHTLALMMMKMKMMHIEHIINQQSLAWKTQPTFPWSVFTKKKEQHMFVSYIRAGILRLFRSSVSSLAAHFILVNLIHFWPAEHDRDMMMVRVRRARKGIILQLWDDDRVRVCGGYTHKCAIVGRRLLHSTQKSFRT